MALLSCNVSEREDKENGAEEIFGEILTENFFKIDGN